MCGIVAILNSNPSAVKAGNKTPAPGPYKQNSLLHDMLLASAVRGTDGTGLFQVDKTLEVWTGKKAEPSASAMNDSGIGLIVKDTSNCSITVGHVRAATQGSVSDDNCHPFQAFRDDGTYIIGVHNGTLYGWDTPASGYAVDSEWAFNEIATKGADAFKEFYGAYTFLWHDSREPGKLFMARNDERPMHLIRSSDGRSIYMASEAGMLQWLVDKHKMSVEHAVYSLDTNVIASVDTTKAQLEVVNEEAIEDNTTYLGYNYTPAPSAACPVPSKTYTSSTTSVKGLLVIAMKDCLRRSRYKLAKGVEVEDDPLLLPWDGEDDGPIEMGPVDMPYRNAPSAWYSADGVDAADVARAMREGLYGSLVQFDAVEHDSFQDHIVGEIVAPAKLQSPMAYLYEVSMEEAPALVDTMMPAVIVGARPFGDEMEYIVSRINAEGKKALAA